MPTACLSLPWACDETILASRGGFTQDTTQRPGVMREGLNLVRVRQVAQRGMESCLARDEGHQEMLF